ncbi:unnamed protein product [Prorocentrum cordatum]|uniref:Uncharacterized protein n=1 Tax=Prorocentrum cordatum TaxID=2364126 RepID=A0ABN9YHC8_9DINO|nr:unnamed protein product [Polarella glacialis]
MGMFRRLCRLNVHEHPELRHGAYRVGGVVMSLGAMSERVARSTQCLQRHVAACSPHQFWFSGQWVKQFVSPLAHPCRQSGRIVRAPGGGEGIHQQKRAEHLHAFSDNTSSV